jgi:hypothetical protein
MLNFQSSMKSITQMSTIIFSLALASALSTTSQAGSSTLKLTSNDGIPDFPANGIAQLPDGAIAFGSNRGLAILREGKMSIYTGPYYDPLFEGHGGTVPGNSALSHDEVSAMIVSRDGTL